MGINSILYSTIIIKRRRTIGIKIGQIQVRTNHRQRRRRNTSWFDFIFNRHVHHAIVIVTQLIPNPHLNHHRFARIAAIKIYIRTELRIRRVLTVCHATHQNLVNTTVVRAAVIQCRYRHTNRSISRQSRFGFTDTNRLWLDIIFYFYNKCLFCVSISTLIFNRNVKCVIQHLRESAFKNGDALLCRSIVLRITCEHFHPRIRTRISNWLHCAAPIIRLQSDADTTAA